MAELNYLQWLAAETRTAWWHDSGDPAELTTALANGAVGVTTNPVLAAVALKANRELWRDAIRAAVDSAKNPGAKAEALMRIVVTDAARRLEPVYRNTAGAQGYVCAQVNPSFAGDRAAMEDMARRFDAWAPNIAVKLPATSAGLDVMERCAADGITTTITVSFTVPQVFAAGRRFQEASRRRKPGARAGRCFAVIMIGRLDEYIREVCADNGDRPHERRDPGRWPERGQARLPAVPGKRVRGDAAGRGAARQLPHGRPRRRRPHHVHPSHVPEEPARGSHAP